MLPLFLLGNATDERGLCLGFADALVSHLGNLPGVDVRPTSAVLKVRLDAAGFDLASRLVCALWCAARFKHRYSNDPLAIAEFMHGYRLSSADDPTLLGEAAVHLTNAVTRAAAFSLAHATLSLSGLRGTSNTIRRGPGRRRRNFTAEA
jgi:hypothetical protein